MTRPCWKITWLPFTVRIWAGTAVIRWLHWQPIATTNANQNSTLTLPAAASGNPAIAYQWYDMNSNPVAEQASTPKLSTTSRRIIAITD